MTDPEVNHDHLFKVLLQHFFAEFMELFYPAAAARLRGAEVAFLDKDLFTDAPGARHRGKRREPDVVARVETTAGQPEIVLIHIEVQRRRANTFGTRMAEYYALLRLRHRVPVFPVVIYLTRGAGGLGRDHYQESVFGEVVVDFHYHRVGVPDLDADDYLRSDNPLAYGLAALMRPGPRGRVATKAECLIRIARAVLDESRKLVLANCVETYLRLDENEQEQFEHMVGAPAYQEVTQMLSIYEERGIAKGALKAKRETTLRLLRHKFGALPDAVQDQIQDIRPSPP